MDKPELLKGTFSWRMKRERIYDKNRWAIGIFKGARLVAFIVYHPAAKCHVLNTYDACMTKKCLEFAMPYMDAKLFHSLAKHHAAEERAK